MIIILFMILCIIHVLIWGFVLFAFINKNTARINIYIVIPIIFLLHCLPFHFLVQAKKQLYDTSYLDKESKMYKILIIPDIFLNISKKLEKICTFNPLSPQGMLIIGLITCLFRLYPIKFSNIIQHNK
jgi:hypothetical protein